MQAFNGEREEVRPASPAGVASRSLRDGSVASPWAALVGKRAAHPERARPPWKRLSAEVRQECGCPRTRHRTSGGYSKALASFGLARQRPPRPLEELERKWFALHKQSGRQTGSLLSGSMRSLGSSTDGPELRGPAPVERPGPFIDTTNVAGYGDEWGSRLDASPSTGKERRQREQSPASASLFGSSGR